MTSHRPAPPPATGARPAPTPSATDGLVSRLPAGTLDLAARLLDDAAAAADRAGLDPGRIRAGDAADHLTRPVQLVDDWPGPTPPLPIGGGAVHADLIDDDWETFARLRSILPDERLNPESVAAAAQEWRLPIVPYRPLPTTDRPRWRVPARGRAAPDPDRRPAGRRPLVVDLSALWAGPLATSLLAGAGARVVKVDPSCRPDAFGQHPRLHAHLNGDKEVVDLDLRRDPDRRRFEQLCSRADLLVDSFSRRVLPNLGYGPDALRRCNPRLATLSIVAFDAHRPQSHWVCYGPGVHAMAGLGTVEGLDGPRFEPAPIAYPDALAGLRAAGVAFGLLATGRPTDHQEATLAGAIEPLVDIARSRLTAAGTAAVTGDGPGRDGGVDQRPVGGKVR